MEIVNQKREIRKWRMAIEIDKGNWKKKLKMEIRKQKFGKLKQENGDWKIEMKKLETRKLGNEKWKLENQKWK